LPPHRLIINAIGDADLCRFGLDAAELLLLDCPSPVINAPTLVKESGRLQNVVRFSQIPDVITPKTVQLSKVELLSPTISEFIDNYDLNFPLLLRSPGFHTGQHFLCVEDFDAFYVAVNSLPGEHLLLMQMLNACNEQGDYHKYRVMYIDGVLYPLHLAISRHWKVHYFSANMDDQSVSRQKEKAFLEDMQSVLGNKAVTALMRIGQMLGLEYAGIDFAVTASGDVLLFEANATMVIPMPDADDKWQYRREAVENIQEAVKLMLINRC
jgi:glutathione synthase/RimK-type ligase-like ATP-grasp enzyme